MNAAQFLAASNAGPVQCPLPACIRNEAFEYYQNPGRAYHSWEHVAHVHACANMLFTHLLNDPKQLSELEVTAAVLAISWHDIFQGPNHELASAARLIYCIPSPAAALAARIIVDGTSHFSETSSDGLFKLLGMPLPSSPNLALLTAVIHDADLMVLGESEENYDRYARGILVEALAFGVAPAGYRDRRLQFLCLMKSEAEKGALFATDPARQLNPTVLRNVIRELKCLES